MNFKEQYRATFSEIHASEEMKKKCFNVKNKEGKAIQLTKNKKKIMAILAAAALAAASAVAVNAAEADSGVLGSAWKNLRMYINGTEVSASDYVDGDQFKITSDNGDIVIYKADDLPEQGDGEDGGVTVSVEIHDDETHSASVSITEEAPPTAAQEDASAAKS